MEKNFKDEYFKQLEININELYSDYLRLGEKHADNLNINVNSWKEKKMSKEYVGITLRIEKESMLKLKKILYLQNKFMTGTIRSMILQYIADNEHILNKSVNNNGNKE